MTEALQQVAHAQIGDVDSASQRQSMNERTLICQQHNQFISEDHAVIKINDMQFGALFEQSRKGLMTDIITKFNLQGVKIFTKCVNNFNNVLVCKLPIRCDRLKYANLCL